MRIISNKRYKKLRSLESWENLVLPMRQRQHKINTFKELDEMGIKVMDELEDNIPYFLTRRTGYKKKFLKGEIGMMFGKRIILK